MEIQYAICHNFPILENKKVRRSFVLLDSEYENLSYFRKWESILLIKQQHTKPTDRGYCGPCY